MNASLLARLAEVIRRWYGITDDGVSRAEKLIAAIGELDE